MTKAEKKADYERTSEWLRDKLCDELDAVQSGKTTPQRAIAVAKLAAQVLICARLELDAQSRLPAQPLMLGAR